MYKMVRYLIDSIRIAICLLLPAATILAQTPTVGVLTASPDMAPGYSLFAPNATKNTYLIDNCGQVIQQWGNSNYFPGSAVYLKEDGSLIRTCRVSNSNFVLGGLGGRV
ncbi:MAG TPA: hypothetical protein ENJ82_05135, partial [Bacteroidetes bacterium]|nr:hypothetical protein [Bacteroidota bacterium]